MHTRKSRSLNFAVLLIAGLFVVSGASRAHAVSLGPRATFFQPKDADDGVWSGGLQLRAWPLGVVGAEGSIDYRREKFGATRVDVYPVQVSLLLSVLPIKP